MSIVTDDGHITYVVVGDHHITPDDFETMFNHYLDFVEAQEFYEHP